MLFGATQPASETRATSQAFEPPRPKRTHSRQISKHFTLRTKNNPDTVSITTTAESLGRFLHHRRTEFDPLNSENLDGSRYRKTSNFQMLNYSGWANITDCSVNIAADSTVDCDSYNLCIGESRYIPQSCCNLISRMNR